MNNKIKILRAHGYSLIRAIYFGGYSVAIYQRKNRAVKLVQKDGENRCYVFAK